MKPRASGIFLHPTSLPSPYGIGDLGLQALRWIDQLAAAKQSFWQFCPLGPTGYGDSPYQSLCSFAGNTLLISPHELRAMGLLAEADLQAYPQLPQNHVDFGAVISEKEKLFRVAFDNFSDVPDFVEFCDRESSWLDGYALFRVIKTMHGEKPWWQWEAPYKKHDKSVIATVTDMFADNLRYHKFLQYLFDKQWRKLRAFAAKQGVSLIGDIPFYTAYDSSDTWTESNQFLFDKKGTPVEVAGVPPDYFSKTGQLWGNPLYNWEAMKKNSYSWWRRRVQKALEFADYVRIDHFRAFDSYWAIPYGNSTAVKGKWCKGPGKHFFDTLKEKLGALPLIAEDLGDITKDVITLREDTGAPGMKILQFAFDSNMNNPYLPYNITRDSVTYTGTHDNDTALGWFSTLSDDAKKRVCGYLGCSYNDEKFLNAFIRCALASPSWLCLIPMQDVLALGGRHRMNTPGTMLGNWQWRMTQKMPIYEKLAELAELTKIYGRAGG
ncbi:MAG: 4-alpha-glucanotransferase [Chitinispirillales bacterium]|jgi:4-alpha-glucanotransferase|nr:4-alpha-glucanotransferase [Chitinispirillales bacterium]